MPLDILVGIFALLAALVLYSIGAFAGSRSGRFTTGRVVVLWAGVFFDALATTMMGMQVGGLDLRPGAPLVHTVLALAAMLGMIAGAGVATWALVSAREDVQRGVSRAIFAPWGLWVAVFVWGMVTRGAARMGR